MCTKMYLGAAGIRHLCLAFTAIAALWSNLTAALDVRFLEVPHKPGAIVLDTWGKYTNHACLMLMTKQGKKVRVRM